MKRIFPEYVDQFETVIIERIEAPGAYDNAVQGVDIVVHMASPLVNAGLDNETGLLIPAREGVVNMLKAAIKAPTVRRVVTTSNSTAVMDPNVYRNDP